MSPVLAHHSGHPMARGLGRRTLRRNSQGKENLLRKDISARRTDSYAGVVPLHGEDAATLLIEDGSVGRAAPFGHTATRVIVDISIAVEIGFSV